MKTSLKASAERNTSSESIAVANRTAFSFAVLCASKSPLLQCKCTGAAGSVAQPSVPQKCRAVLPTENMITLTTEITTEITEQKTDFKDSHRDLKTF